MTFLRSPTPLAAILALALPRVAGADSAPPPSQASPPAVASSPPTDTAFVHIEGRPGVRLEARVPQKDVDADENPWVFFCEAPCDLNLSTQLEYRVNATATSKYPTRQFNLKAAPGQREVIAVSLDSHIAVGGIALLSAGIIVSGVGLGAIVAEIFDVATCPPRSEAVSLMMPTPTATGICGSTAVDVGALIALAVGAGLVVAGSMLIGPARHIHQTQTITTLLLLKPSGPEAVGGPPAPAWHGPERFTTPGAPMVAIPLLSRSF
jgi:hypothetical protein